MQRGKRMSNESASRSRNWDERQTVNSSVKENDSRSLFYFFNLILFQCKAEDSFKSNSDLALRGLTNLMGTNRAFSLFFCKFISFSLLYDLLRRYQRISGR